MYTPEERLENRIREIRSLIYQKRLSLNPLEYREKGKSGWRKIDKGKRWGGEGKQVLFRKTFRLPTDFKEEKLGLYVELGEGGQCDRIEGTVYWDGEIVSGTSTVRSELLLTTPMDSNREHTLEISAYSGILNAGPHTFWGVDLLAIDEEVEDFYFNCDTALAAAREITDAQAKETILELLSKAIQKVDFPVAPSKIFYQQLREANSLLKEKLYKLAPPLKAKITAIGHAHLDVAWKWSLAVTRDKFLRTTSNVLYLMQKYPKFRFTQSQAQLYQFLKEDYPEVYKKVKSRVKEGSWEPTGATWVEMDCNLPAGESMVRQFLYGKTFFQKEFGLDSKVFLVPDTFGFSASLPQIMKKSGVEYFVTAKLNWYPSHHKFPHDTFRWEGIDGTQVLAYILPLGVYNLRLTPEQQKESWEGYLHKKITQNIMLTYGYGDGGGGPTREMMETGKRMKDFPCFPQIEFGKAEDYFAFLNRSRDKFPLWRGELYYENHRGTYTSQGKTKWNNRKSEVLLQQTEFLATLSCLLKNSNYPSESINKAWELVLLNQFHDIIPGSSIREVYEESEKQYQEVRKIGEQIIHQSMEKICSSLNLPSSLTVFNSLSWERKGLVEIEQPSAQKTFIDHKGNPLPYQPLKNRKILLEVKNIPACGYKTFPLKRSKKTSPFQSNLKITPTKLENKFSQIKLNSSGEITSLKDKTKQREVLVKGAVANQFIGFEDKPSHFDAWNISQAYEDKYWLAEKKAKIQVTEKGPLRGALKIEKQILNSKITQYLYIYQDIPRIDFSTEVDWKEHQVLLKVAFPVEVNAENATYDIQFGNMQRSVKRNTSWEQAKFEVSAHKWADLSEGDYGVSLLNDCKYGHDIKNKTMRLTLIKSPIDPDPQADQGKHIFTYSLYPHPSTWKEADTVKQGYDLNYPLRTYFKQARTGKLPPALSLFSLDKENLILETIKKEENGEGVVLRLYECYNQRGVAKLTLPEGAKEVWECNLLEKENKKLKVWGNKVSFNYLPYEIKTLKIISAPAEIIRRRK